MATKVEIIRTYLTEHPEVGPKAMAQQIADEHKGLKVSPSEVSNIKSLMKKERAQAPAQPAAKANDAPKARTRKKRRRMPTSPTRAPAATNGRAAQETGPARTSPAEQVAKL